MPAKLTFQSLPITHPLHRIEKKAVSVKRLSEIGDEWKRFQVLGIDEG